MAEITVEHDGTRDQLDADVAKALGTGYVILHDDDTGAATIITDAHTDDQLAQLVDDAPALTATDPPPSRVAELDRLAEHAAMLDAAVAAEQDQADAALEVGDTPAPATGDVAATTDVAP